MITPHHIESPFYGGAEFPTIATVAHTGHRSVDSAHLPRLNEGFRIRWRDGPTRLVVVGGAMGWDTIVAENALLYPKTCRLLIARPFAGHESGWPAEWRKRFLETWSRADVRVTVCAYDRFTCRKSYHIRNGYMLDLAQNAVRELGPGWGYLDSYWDGVERNGSGTWATIREALRREMSVNNYFPGQHPRVKPSVLLPTFNEGRLFA